MTNNRIADSVDDFVLGGECMLPPALAVKSRIAEHLAPRFAQHHYQEPVHRMPFGDFGLPALLAERQTGVLGAAVDFPGEARLLKYAATPSEPALVIPPKWYRHPFDAWLFYQAHRRAA